jgi:hypothetical protein
MYRVSKKLEAFFHTPIPRELWHYTSLKALDGILSSGKIWATEARFTSDTTEYVFARQVATDYVNSLKPQKGYAQLGIDDLLKLLDISYEKGVLSRDFADVFIASFSAAEDLKSQWIDYGNDYKGVSIAFDLRHARPASELDTSTTLAPCIYQKHEQEELIQEAVSRFLEPINVLQSDDERNYALKRIWPTVQCIWPNAGDPPYIIRTKTEIKELLQQGTGDMNRDLFVLTSHCKNLKFFEEQEWRLVFPRSKKKNHPLVPIKFRKANWHGSSIDIPYIEFGLQAPDTDRLPISRVMAGPHCDTAEVEAILKRHDYDVPVTISQVPIR